ncbi:MAG TPA: class I SAM-dependent methyltransferase [Candidatus Solibacter sp.]|nr:class I SAM-dependent methyltransferase [Candidatus Solibacter sp.]
MPTKSAADVEDARIRTVYSDRRKNIPGTLYARTNPFSQCSSHEREEAMAALFRQEGLLSLAGLRILDVGCGRGETMRQLLEYGANPKLVSGIDLLEENINDARRLAPHIHAICGSACKLPFPDECFNLVIQFMLFTSVLDDGVKSLIAAELNRVLIPGGRILWYDFTFDNPKNPNVHGITKSEIKELFPEFEMRAKRITLAPPVGRIVAPISSALYYCLSRLPPLCTHLLCFLKKPGGTSGGVEELTS